MAWNDLKKGRFSTAGGEYFITFNCDKKRPVFNNFELARIFCRHIKLNEMQYNCNWFTWILMPDHFHGLLQLSDQFTLSQVVGGLKGASSRVINQKLQRQGRLWQTEFYDRALRSEENRKSIARYIVANPLRKGLVDNVGDYPFWNSTFL